jgi:hypothetical protein
VKGARRRGGCGGRESDEFIGDRDGVVRATQGTHERLEVGPWSDRGERKRIDHPVAATVGVATDDELVVDRRGRSGARGRFFEEALERVDDLDHLHVRSSGHQQREAIEIVVSIVDARYPAVVAHALLLACVVVWCPWSSGSRGLLQSR